MDEIEEYWYEVIYYVGMPVSDASKAEVVAAQAEEPDSVRLVTGVDDA